MDLLLAYAIRSPLGSEDSWVGWPRVVVGAAAHMASIVYQYPQFWISTDSSSYRP